jgi:hypothetical protein
MKLTCVQFATYLPLRFNKSLNSCFIFFWLVVLRRMVLKVVVGLVNAVPAYGMFGRDRRGGLAACGAGGDHAVPEYEYMVSKWSADFYIFLYGCGS